MVRRCRPRRAHVPQGTIGRTRRRPGGKRFTARDALDALEQSLHHRRGVGDVRERSAEAAHAAVALALDLLAQHRDALLQTLEHRLSLAEQGVELALCFLQFLDRALELFEAPSVGDSDGELVSKRFHHAPRFTLEDARVKAMIDIERAQ